MRISCVWYIEEVDDFSNLISGGSSKVHGVRGRGWDGGIQFVNRAILRVKHQLFYHVVVGFPIIPIFPAWYSIWTLIDDFGINFVHRLITSIYNLLLQMGKTSFILFHYFLFILHANVHSEYMFFILFPLKKKFLFIRSNVDNMKKKTVTLDRPVHKLVLYKRK